jgi:hypothetical protein
MISVCSEGRCRLQERTGGDVSLLMLKKLNT